MKKECTPCKRSLSFLRAALNAGGSSSSRSTVSNSSKVKALDGVSPNSINLHVREKSIIMCYHDRHNNKYMENTFYLLRRVDSCTLTIFIMSAGDLLNSCNRAAISKAVWNKNIYIYTYIRKHANIECTKVSKWQNILKTKHILKKYEDFRILNNI